MDAGRKAGPVADQAHSLARFWQAASHFWCGRWGWVAWRLTILLVLIVLAQLLVQYLLNRWNRNFFDAIERRDVAALWAQAGVFVVLAAASTALAATSVWGRMTTQRKWRESLLRHVAEYWLAKDRFRRLDYVGSGCENPEYRVSEDIRIATDAPIDLVMAFLASVLTAIVFIGILWDIGGDLTFAALGTTWTIPFYLVIGVIAYSSVFSVLMIMVGRNLTGVIEREIQGEAELRAAADALRRSNDGTGSHDNATAERRTFWMAVHVVLLRWRNLAWQLVRTTLVSHTNFLLAPVVAWFLCLPKFVAGAMTLGELTQAAAAFVTVQGAFNWLVDNYSRLADWRAAAHRVAALLVALDALNACDGVESNGAVPLPCADAADRPAFAERAMGEHSPEQTASMPTAV